MKLTTRAQKIESSSRGNYVAVDIIVSHNGKAAIWRTAPRNPALTHKMIETMNKMVQSLAKQFPELIDKEPKKSAKKVTAKKVAPKRTAKKVVVSEVEVAPGIKAIKTPGEFKLD